MSLAQLRKRKAWKGLGLKTRFKVAEPNCENLGRDCGFYYMCRGKPLRQVGGRPSAWVRKEGSLASTLSLYRYESGGQSCVQLREPQLCVDRGRASHQQCQME